MKKLILTLLSLAIIIAGGLVTLAVYHRYENYQTTQRLERDREQAKISSKLQAVRNDLEDENTTLKSDYNTLHTECIKGVALYDLLTVANQRKTTAPNCGEAK